MAGISTLAIDFPVLIATAIEGLKSMETNKVAQKYLQIQINSFVLEVIVHRRG